MIDRWIHTLHSELELTAEEIADITWLALIQRRAALAQQPKIAVQPRGNLTSPPPLPPPPLKASSPSTPPADQEPKPAPTPPSQQGVFPRQPTSPQGKSPTRQPQGMPIKVLRAPAVREPLALIRALRPLIRQVSTGREAGLDEAATADRIADERLWLPILKPETEPWLDLALVIDESPSMLIWQRTVTELQRLLKHYGAFRDVRTWGMVTIDSAPDRSDSEQSQAGESVAPSRQVYLRPEVGGRITHQGLRQPSELIDPKGRRLVLVVTDCISTPWREGLVLPPLKIWADHGPVAIVQMLPEWMWVRTALRQGAEAQFYALEPGLANQRLLIHGSPLLEGLENGEPPGVKLPVLTLDPEPLSRWSQMVVGRGSAYAPGVVFNASLQADWVQVEQRRQTKAAPDPTAMQRVQRFETASTPMARQLARLIAAAPVISLPVVRLIQEILLRGSRQTHVAEVLFGGLLNPTVAPTPTTNPDEVIYAFVDPEMRPILLEDAPVTGTTEVLSNYVTRHLGKASLDVFIAEVRSALQGEGNLDGEDVRPFAIVAAEVLKRRGGQYADFVRDVEQRCGSGSGGPSGTRSLPELRVLEFETGQFVEVGLVDGSPPLQTAIVEVVTIEFEADELDPARLELVQTLDALPLAQFEELVFALQVPNRAVPPRFPTGGNRSRELLTWVEGPTGPGLAALRAILSQFLVPTSPEIPGTELVTFAFDVATLERGLFRRNTWSVRTQQRQAQRYIERLGNSIFIAMVVIPGGSFVMGSPSDEPERFSNEGPQHDVQVSDFWMGRYPVTQIQWRAVAAMPQQARELNPDPSRFKGDNRPVEQVSWYDAVEFCARLSAHTGRAYRLPTEAEWEYACRARTTTPFSFGDMITPEVANYNGSYVYNNGPKGENRGETTPVDHFKVANGFGLSDMHGNVYEWCQDHYHSSYEGAPKDGRAWVDENAEENASRVLRGGAWYTLPWVCRSAYRIYDYPRGSLTFIGFRVVCVAPRVLG